MRKGRIACVVIFVLIVLVLSSTFFMPNPSVKAAKTIDIIVNTPDSTIRARADGYAVYNLSITDTVTETLTLDAASANGWETTFLNESGMPITSISASPTITYVYLKVHVPAGTPNGTSDTETVYANNTTAGSASAVLMTTCELFGSEAVPAGPTPPHAVLGTVKYTNGSHADSAFVLLINMATGETSYDTVGTTGASGISGNYSTDTSQFPKGFDNGDLLKVIADDGTNYGVKTLTADNTTEVQWANITLDITGGVVPPDTPSGAMASKSGNDVVITWADVAGETGYRVYSSADRFAAFGTWALETTVGANVVSWPDTGEAALSGSKYYIVRAYTTGATPEESGNSTMTVKASRVFAYNSSKTNINWVSLPYCSYTTASDVVLAIEGGTGSGTNVKIGTIFKWDALNQTTVLYYYQGGFGAGWKGTNFVINPGDGIALGLSGNTASFTWVVVGSDVSSTQKLVYNSSKTNINWVGISYTGVYGTASDVVLAIEGGTGSGTNVKIGTIFKWDALNQTTVLYYYQGGFGAGWKGTNFVINPGDGIALGLSGNTASFTWDTLLITPPQPDNPYIET